MKICDDFKSSEGLSEREVRILVQDEFTPITNKHVQHNKNLSIKANIQSGSGLPSTTTSTSEDPLKVQDSVLASMAAKIPIVPTMSLTTAGQTKVAATSGDLCMTGRDFLIVETNEDKGCFFY